MTIKKTKQINPKNLLDLGNWCIAQVMRSFWRLYDACCCLNQSPEVFCDANRTWFISRRGKIGYINYDSGDLCIAYKGYVVSHVTGGWNDRYTYFQIANRTSKGLQTTESTHGVLFHWGKIVYDGRAVGVQFCEDKVLLKIETKDSVTKYLIIDDGKILTNSDNPNGSTCKPIELAGNYATIQCCYGMFYIEYNGGGQYYVIVFSSKNEIIFWDLGRVQYSLYYPGTSFGGGNTGYSCLPCGYLPILSSRGFSLIFESKVVFQNDSSVRGFYAATGTTDLCAVYRNSPTGLGLYKTTMVVTTSDKVRLYIQGEFIDETQHSAGLYTVCKSAVLLFNGKFYNLITKTIIAENTANEFWHFYSCKSVCNDNWNDEMPCNSQEKWDYYLILSVTEISTYKTSTASEINPKVMMPKNLFGGSMPTAETVQQTFKNNNGILGNFSLPEKFKVKHLTYEGDGCETICELDLDIDVLDDYPYSNLYVMYKTDLVLYADKYLDMVPFVNHNAVTPAITTKSIFRVNNNYFFILEQVQGGNPSNYTSKVVNESAEVLVSSYGSAVNNWVYNLTIACNRSEGIYLSTGTGNPQYSGWAAWLTKLSEDGFYEFARGSNGGSSVTTGMQCDDCKRTRLGMYSGETTIGYTTGETDDSQVINTLWDKPVPKELPYTARGLTYAPYQCCGGNKEIIAFYLDANDQYIWNNSATNIAKFEIWCRGDFLTRVSTEGFQCCDRFIISKKENETNLYEIWTYSDNEPKHWEFTFLSTPSIANCCNGIMRINVKTSDGDRCIFFGYEGKFAESDAKDCNDYTILCCGIKRAIAVNANISFVVDDTFGLIPIDMFNLKVLDNVHKTDFLNYNETRIKKLTMEDIE